MYKLVKYSEIEPYIKYMENNNISTVARSKDGFLSYFKNNPILNTYWTNKRNAFIKRHLGAAILNKEDLKLYPIVNNKTKTSRRALALLAWSYKI